jgi:hypothetical protein
MRFKVSVIHYTEPTGSFEYCRQQLDMLQMEALNIVEQLEVTLGRAIAFVTSSICCWWPPR